MTSIRNQLVVCATLPAAALAAAHWFPWQATMSRDLHRLEAYAIGTTAIVATAAVSIATSNGSGKQHASLLLTATASAGIITLAAWAWDAILRLRAAIIELGAYSDALGYVRQDRN